MIVVDVGCARYGGDYSIERLIERFQPTQLYGFDPAWRPEMFDPPDDLRALVLVSNEVAWTYDGKVRFMLDGLNGHMTSHGEPVPCIDLARFIAELPEDEIVLKLDCEGSEYRLLQHLIDRKVDGRLKVALVEWHDSGTLRPPARRHIIERSIHCDLEEWRH